MSRLERLRDYFAGAGDLASQRDIARQLADSQSDVSQLMALVREASSEWLDLVRAEIQVKGADETTSQTAPTGEGSSPHQAAHLVTPLLRLELQRLTKDTRRQRKRLTGDAIRRFVDDLRSELDPARDWSTDEATSFYGTVSEVVAGIVADYAREALLDTTAVSGDTTESDASADVVSQAEFKRMARVAEVLDDVDAETASVFCLAEFAGRTPTEIAQLRRVPQDDAETEIRHAYALINALAD